MTDGLGLWKMVQSLSRKGKKNEGIGLMRGLVDEKHKFYEGPTDDSDFVQLSQLRRGVDFGSFKYLPTREITKGSAQHMCRDQIRHLIDSEQQVHAIFARKRCL